MTVLVPNLENITNFFLYGSTTTPTNLLDVSLLRASNVVTTAEIDGAAFMSTGAGRFAKGASSALVDEFFDTENIIAAGYYTKVQLGTLLGVSSYGINFSANDYDDAANDILELTYIWHSQKFKLDDVTFVVDGSCNRTIENYRVIPNENLPAENFDFVGDGWATNLANQHLRVHTDPWNIGRRVDFDFDISEISTTTYTYQDYLDEEADLATWAANGESLENLANDMEELIDDFFTLGLTEFVDPSGRAIVYGSVGDDSITIGVTLLAAPLLEAAASENGVSIVLGSGDDYAHGNIKTDLLLGGADNDILLGNDGDDVIEGNEGRDVLIGGKGSDTLSGDNGDDLIFTGQLLGNGDGEGIGTIEGGGGTDHIVFGYSGYDEIVLPGGNTEDRLYIRGDVLELENDEILPILGGINFEYDYDEDGTEDCLWSRLAYEEEDPYFPHFSEYLLDVMFLPKQDDMKIVVEIAHPSNYDIVRIVSIYIEDFEEGDYGIQLGDVQTDTAKELNDNVEYTCNGGVLATYEILTDGDWVINDL